MPKNDNAHALRLCSALENAGHADVAETLAADFPLSKSADVSKKHQWACDVCERLSTVLPQEEAAQIRRACRCNDGKTMAQEISVCIRNMATLREACTLFTKQNKYAFLEYVSDHELLFGYDNCVCSCIKRADGNVPMLWCECSAGYAEAMFRQVFGSSVAVTLLESVKCGDERCILRVDW